MAQRSIPVVVSGCDNRVLCAGKRQFFGQTADLHAQTAKARRRTASDGATYFIKKPARYADCGEAGDVGGVRLALFNGGDIGLKFPVIHEGASRWPKICSTGRRDSARKL